MAIERSWTEFVGMPAEYVRDLILADNPSFDVVVLPLGSPVT
jgi:hypothetical protein